MVNPKPSYFSGYVFRGDTRKPEIIFERGFELQLEPYSRRTESRIVGAIGGITGTLGVSTSVCASACGHYSFRPTELDPFTPGGGSGFVYLIDATEFKGFAIPTPRPDDPIVSFNPILRDIYEVNFASYITGNYIVGIVWAYGKQDEGWLNSRGFWPYNPARLWLAVNPYFEKPLLQPDRIMKGMEAAIHVQNQFNDH